jgi:heat shock protein HslJ
MKKRMQLFIISCTISVMVVGCIGQQSEGLEDIIWKLDSYYTPSGVMRDVLADSEITATFEDDQIQGNAGCNHYFGEYELHDTTLTVGTLAMTEMYCATPGIMEQESAYLTLLESVASYRVQGTTLTLLNAEGLPVLIFTGES